MKHREIRWHFIGNCSMGLHHLLLNMGTGDSIRHLHRAQDNSSGSWKERFAAGTPSDVSPKASCKLSLKHRQREQEEIAGEGSEETHTSQRLDRDGNGISDQVARRHRTWDQSFVRSLQISE